MKFDLCKCGVKKQANSKNCRQCYINSVKKNDRICIDCGAKTPGKKGKRCYQCYRQFECRKCLDLDEPIKNFLYREANNPNHFVKIRQNARRVAKVLGMLDNGCSCCPFNFVAEVCHIKAISAWDVLTPINVVNHPDNLIILCPNCHWLFDHGYPCLEQIKQYYQQFN